jgi:hypothetical protein
MGAIMPGPTYFIFAIFQALLVPGLIVGVIIYLIRRRGNGGNQNSERNRFVRSDQLSEILLLLSVFFFGSFLLGVNRQLVAGIEWQWILFVLTVTGFALSYNFSLRYTLFFSMIGFLIWWAVQGTLWADNPSLLNNGLGLTAMRLPSLDGATNTGLSALESFHVKYGVLLSGLLLISILYYAVSFLHGKIIPQSRFSSLYAITGIIVVTAVLFIFSQRDGVNWFADLTEGLTMFASWQITLGFFSIAAAVFGTLIFAAFRKLADEREIGFLFAIALLALLLAFLPQLQLYSTNEYGSHSGLGGGGFLLALLFNALLFIELVAIIFSGYIRKEVWRINIGAVLLFLFIIIKYFDWFFTFLDKSIFFISAGILLFGVGYFMERGRRVMVNAVNTKEEK